MRKNNIEETFINNLINATLIKPSSIEKDLKTILLVIKNTLSIEIKLL